MSIDLKEREDLLNDMLVALGHPRTVTNRQQLEVMLEALDIYVQRNETREDLWAQFDTADAGMHVRSKGARLQQHALLDDALDAINYGAFAARHLLKLVPPGQLAMTERPPMEGPSLFMVVDREGHVRQRTYPGPCHCGHPYSHHDARVAGRSQAEIQLEGARGSCGNMGCACQAYENARS